MRATANNAAVSNAISRERSVRYAPLVSICSLSLLLLSPADVLAWESGEQPAIRGITVGPIESSLQPGRGYGTECSAVLLDELVRMGVNWVSITPFGRIWSIRHTEILMDFEAPYQENRRALGRFVEQAKARGLRVMVVPHLWVETGEWRGEMDPGSTEGWEAYRQSYRSFVMRWAADAAEWGADGFSIGVECKSWSGRFGGWWEQLIADIRRVFPGLLTYSANWDEVENVLFWDRLDLVGINAFYPLADKNDASYDQYLQGALRQIDNLRELSRTLDMPILFVEVGYTTRSNAAVEPWLWPDDMQSPAVDEWEQARALSAILEAALPNRWMAGFFLWRYYANLDDVSQEAIWGFSPHGKLAEPMLREIFAVRWGADPEPLPGEIPRFSPGSMGW
jgi:hypothetical protein